METLKGFDLVYMVQVHSFIVLFYQTPLLQCSDLQSLTEVFF